MPFKTGQQGSLSTQGTQVHKFCIFYIIWVSYGFIENILYAYIYMGIWKNFIKA